MWFKRNPAIQAVLVYGQPEVGRWEYVFALPSVRIDELPFEYEQALVKHEKTEIVIRAFPSSRTVGDVYDQSHVHRLVVDAAYRRHMANEIITKRSADGWLAVKELALGIMAPIYPKGTVYKIGADEIRDPHGWPEKPTKALPIQRGEL